MSEELKIDEKSWEAKDDVALDDFSTAVANVMLTDPRYKDLLPEAQLLSASASNFHLKLAADKTFGGTSNRTALTYAKNELWETHATVAKRLVATAAGNKEYIEFLGYILEGEDGKEGGRSTAMVKRPIKKKVENGKNRGEVKFILIAEKPREIKGIVGEFTTDGAKTWQGGLFATRLSFELDGQPSGLLVGYRFYFLATNNRKSKFSEVIWWDVY